VGTIPYNLNCPNNKENSGGLCYNKCNNSYYGVGPSCYKNNKPWWWWMAAWKFQYWRGVGTIPNYDCNLDKVKIVGLCYNKCKDGYYNFGGNLCSQSFTKNIYSRGVGTIPTKCANNREYQDGLCYVKNIKKDYICHGPVCWKKCDEGYKDGGAKCSTSIAEAFLGSFGKAMDDLHNSDLPLGEKIKLGLLKTLEFGGQIISGPVGWAQIGFSETMKIRFPKETLLNHGMSEDEADEFLKHYNRFAMIAPAVLSIFNPSGGGAIRLANIASTIIISIDKIEKMIPNIRKTKYFIDTVNDAFNGEIHQSIKKVAETSTLLLLEQLLYITNQDGEIDLEILEELNKDLALEGKELSINNFNINIKNGTFKLSKSKLKELFREDINSNIKYYSHIIKENYDTKKLISILNKNSDIDLIDIIKDTSYFKKLTSKLTQLSKFNYKKSNMKFMQYFLQKDTITDKEYIAFTTAINNLVDTNYTRISTGYKKDLEGLDSIFLNNKNNSKIVFSKEIIKLANLKLNDNHLIKKISKKFIAQSFIEELGHKIEYLYKKELQNSSSISKESLGDEGTRFRLAIISQKPYDKLSKATIEDKIIYKSQNETLSMKTFASFGLLNEFLVKNTKSVNHGLSLGMTIVELGFTGTGLKNSKLFSTKRLFGTRFSISQPRLKKTKYYYKDLITNKKLPFYRFETDITFKGYNRYDVGVSTPSSKMALSAKMKLQTVQYITWPLYMDERGISTISQDMKNWKYGIENIISIDTSISNNSNNVKKRLPSFVGKLVSSQEFEASLVNKTKLEFYMGYNPNKLKTIFASITGATLALEIIVDSIFHIATNGKFLKRGAFHTGIGYGTSKTMVLMIQTGLKIQKDDSIRFSSIRNQSYLNIKLKKSIKGNFENDFLKSKIKDIKFPSFKIMEGLLVYSLKLSDIEDLPYVNFDAKRVYPEKKLYDNYDLDGNIIGSVYKKDEYKPKNKYLINNPNNTVDPFINCIKDNYKLKYITKNKEIQESNCKNFGLELYKEKPTNGIIL
jgi:hypothetical protein